MADARVSQSVVEAVVLNPATVQIRVSQSVIEVLALPFVPPPPVAVTVAAPLGGAGGFRPAYCGCAPELLTAERLRRLRALRDAWPYRHCFPTAADVELNEENTIAAPAAGSAAVVLAYTVPAGLRLILQGVFLAYDGVFSPGDALWTIDDNSEAASVQASPIQGLIDLPIPLGSLLGGSPWWFPRAYEFGSLHHIRSTVFNVSLAGGSFTSVFLGYLIPDVAE